MRTRFLLSFLLHHGRYQAQRQPHVEAFRALAPAYQLPKPALQL